MHLIKISVASLLFSFSVLAQQMVLTTDQDKKTEALVEAAQKKFKATFSNTQSGITSFQPSPIKGVFEMKTQTGIIYFYPDGDLLIFGKIYNKDGLDLTAVSERNHNSNILSNIPLEHALIIGNPEAKTSLIEFTNPDCGHCINYDRWTDTQSDADVKRYVFFLVQPGYGMEKAVHILCHPEDYKKIFNRQEISLKTCDEGVERLKHHSTAVNIASPTGTPSFIVDGKPFVGFDETILTNLYRKSK